MHQPVLIMMFLWINPTQTASAAKSSSSTKHDSGGSGSGGSGSGSKSKVSEKNKDNLEDESSSALFGIEQQVAFPLDQQSKVRPNGTDWVVIITPDVSKGTVLLNDTEYNLSDFHIFKGKNRFLDVCGSTEAEILDHATCYNSQTGQIQFATTKNSKTVDDDGFTSKLEEG
jgi:hypothetical protein